MVFSIELESNLERGPEDEYPSPCKNARMVRNLCIYPDNPNKFDEPVFEVSIDSLEELLALIAEVAHPIEIDGDSIIVKDRCY